MANVSIRQPVAVHVASEVVRVGIRLDALRKVARVEFARNCDAAPHLKRVLLGLLRVDLDVF